MKTPLNYLRSGYIRNMAGLFVVSMAFTANIGFAQSNPVVDNIVKEGTQNSQLEKLAHELFDKVGPRLTGTPQMKMANDWAVDNYTGWGISARNEQWGEWKAWERGITHIDMVSPRVKSLEGTQLAWSGATKSKGVTAELVIIPEVADSMAFQAWLPTVKGKFVMVSMNQPTGRPDYNWKEFATKESMDKMTKDRAAKTTAWTARIKKTGYSARMLQIVLEKAGAAGIVTNTWSQGFGVDKIFYANATKIPTVDIALEDYGMLYRLVENGDNPVISIRADSKHTGTTPTYNTIAEIKGTEKPDEYVMLSAHFDSWDGGTGATDNGTGTLTMMEAMRILKLIYPNPKRTILVGHWASEEQGLNGSRAFTEDHPEMMNKIQALFNQDNGTGRVVSINGAGFKYSGDFLPNWLAAVPKAMRDSIRTSYPGSPAGGGSDNASFVAAGAPGFSLGALNWSYFNYTWHTNRDTYDKVVFDDLRNNAILTAILVYMACEDPKFMPHDKADLNRTPPAGGAAPGGRGGGGRGPATWPAPVKAIRKGPVAPVN